MLRHSAASWPPRPTTWAGVDPFPHSDRARRLSSCVMHDSKAVVTVTGSWRHGNAGVSVSAFAERASAERLRRLAGRNPMPMPVGPGGIGRHKGGHYRVGGQVIRPLLQRLPRKVHELCVRRVCSLGRLLPDSRAVPGKMYAGRRSMAPALAPDAAFARSLAGVGRLLYHAIFAHTTRTCLGMKSTRTIALLAISPERRGFRVSGPGALFPHYS